MHELAEAIRTSAARLAERTMAHHFEYRPDLEAVYGAHSRLIYVRDCGFNLEALAAALTFEMPDLFADHVAYLHNLLSARSIPTSGLPLHFKCMGQTLREEFGEAAWAQMEPYLRAGMQVLEMDGRA